MNTIGKEALNLLFREVRSYNACLDTPFAGGVIRQIHEGSKFEVGPTIVAHRRRPMTCEYWAGPYIRQLTISG